MNEKTTEMTTEVAEEKDLSEEKEETEIEAKDLKEVSVSRTPLLQT